MIVYIYDNGFCDPLNNVGTAKQFNDSNDVDAFLQFFIASMTARAVYSGRFRIFITGDDVSFDEMDHFVLMDEGYHLNFTKRDIEEVNIPDMAAQVNEQFTKVEKARGERTRKQEKRIKEHVEKKGQN